MFSQLYGSGTGTRIARDFMNVPAWLKGGPEPSTVRETIFRPGRLKTPRMKLPKMILSSRQKKARNLQKRPFRQAVSEVGDALFAGGLLMLILFDGTGPFK